MIVHNYPRILSFDLWRSLLNPVAHRLNPQDHAGSLHFHNTNDNLEIEYLLNELRDVKNDPFAIQKMPDFSGDVWD